MPLDMTEILTLTNTQAKELAGRLLRVGAETYYFKDYDRDYPGQPPWRSGAEGKAYPLLGYDHSVIAYLKFFTRPTQKRLDRTAWLIAQGVHTWLPGLSAAPMIWGDTRYSDSPDGPFDIAGYLARAVPGKTWLELKTAIADNSVRFTEELRRRCVADLLAALAVLEQEGIVHGDLSPNNIVVDVAARPELPALYLIDFDAFVADAAADNRAVAVVEGGTYGTEGYCPPDLAAAAAEGDGRAAPRSDRYGRDMLLLELLVMDSGISPDDPPTSWGVEQLQRRYAALRARGNAGLLPILSHLDPATLFTLTDEARPSSVELAAALGLAPVKRPPRQLSRVRAFTPIVLGQPVTSALAGQLVRQWGPVRPGLSELQLFVPWKWRRPAGDPYLRYVRQNTTMALIAVVLLMLFCLLLALFAAIFAQYRPARAQSGFSGTAAGAFLSPTTCTRDGALRSIFRRSRSSTTLRRVRSMASRSARCICAETDVRPTASASRALDSTSF
jgi:hypothetical protein